LVSLGCECMEREGLLADIQASGRPAELLVIQEFGGTASTIARSGETVASIKQQLNGQTHVPMALEELVVGTICGGSDGTSGITANPAVGRCFDKLVAQNVACMFEETGELIGCENIMAERAVTPALGKLIEECVAKAENYYRVMGFGSFAPGNADGGLTTLEEKSMGAYSKSGSSPIAGLIKPG